MLSAQKDVGLAVGPKEAHGDQNGNSVNSKKDSVSSQQQVYENTSVELEETNPTTLQ